MKSPWLWFGLLIVALVGVGYALVPGRSVTCALVSPDGRWEARLVEDRLQRISIDRNFEVWLVSPSTGERTVLYDSPDEGRPVGTEQFYWSDDSRYLLLAGKQFFVDEEIELADGRLAYWLYDAESREQWCRAKQRSSQSPALTREKVRESFSALLEE